MCSDGLRERRFAFSLKKPATEDVRSMKRSRTQPQGLKHLPFFEVLGEAPEESPAACAATAGLLALRLIDHWVLAGPVMVEPEAKSIRSVGEAIMKLAGKEPGGG